MSEAMKAVVNTSLLPDGAGLAIQKVNVPELSRGEVLVRVRVSTVSPADHMLTEGGYYFPREAPFVPGLAAVGEIVDHRAGLYGRYLTGKRVFFAPGYERDGTWSEFAVADANAVVPLGDLDDERAVSLGNALTAVGLVETARDLRGSGVVVNAAGGNLAGLIAERRKAVGMKMVAIVRKDEEVRDLQAAGAAEVVLNQTDADFAEQLESAADRLDARVLIDSLGGGASAGMMKALPRGSTVLVIGHLSRQPMTFDALPLLLGRSQTVRAFGLVEWMDGLSLPRLLLASRNAQALVRGHAAMPVRHRYSLEQLVERFTSATRGTSEGRTLVFPNGDPASAV
ncbi:MAG: zinc-binding dehydrogenase [Sandaracinaceae bacterium]